MASSSRVQAHETSSAPKTRISVAEPRGVTAEEIKILESQVLIPFPPLSKHAYLVPIAHTLDKTEIMKEIFPSHHELSPRIFAKGPYMMDFMNNPARVFKTNPQCGKHHPLYLSWKEQGIYDLIQLLKYGPKYQAPMLLAALHLWDNTTNSLHLKCSMLAPTLLDVAAITGLKPTGPVFDLSATCDAYSFNFDVKRARFQNYITDHHDSSSEEVYDQEYLAFLTLWLSHYVFCSASLHVAKMYINLAIQLHERREGNLSQLILGALYEGLHLGAQTLRDLSSKNLQAIDNYKISGPIWLFQLWLFATFESKLQLQVATDYTGLVEARSFEGLRLALLKAIEIGVEDPDLFSRTFKMFMDCDEFIPAMAPFAIRTCGPT